MNRPSAKSEPLNRNTSASPISRRGAAVACGARSGRGGGYYDAFVDRYFGRCEASGYEPPPLVALAFSAQVLPAGEVPMARWDRRVDALATADGVLGCGSKIGEAIASGSRWRGAGEGWDCEVLAS